MKARIETASGEWQDKIPAWIKWATQEWNEVLFNGEGRWLHCLTFSVVRAPGWVQHARERLPRKAVRRRPRANVVAGAAAATLDQLTVIWLGKMQSSPQDAGRTVGSRESSVSSPQQPNKTHVRLPGCPACRAAGVYWEPTEVGAPGEIGEVGSVDKKYTFKYPRPPR